ncbi:MAG: glutaredoxin family protein [Patescibacteria group bacterium]
MIIIYTKLDCPYCEKVKNRIGELAIPYTEKSIADEGVAEELIAKGGKRQVPYLIDSERDISIYGENAIVDYLESLRI